MCCASPDWKREEVPDHKFDFVDVSEFRITGFFTRMRYVDGFLTIYWSPSLKNVMHRYVWVYILVLKSFLVYVADAYTAIAMLASNRWSGSIIANAGDSTVVSVPFSIGKWIFCGCIIFSFLLLAWEARKARAIIRSRDISYAFTNVMANNYYSMKSYNHFCFFCQINNSKKKKDEFAFFVFFTFKGWKRLLLADAPRQVINGLTLYSFGKAVNFTTNLSAYYEGSVIKAGILVTMIFTVVVWLGSAILLLIAAVLYIPLLCYIQGNLKEYCCHKIDKRIAELMKRRARKRLAQEAALARKEAAGDFSHLKDKNGNLTGKPMAQPTLPDIDFDDEDHYYAKGQKELNYGYPPSNPYQNNPLQSQPWSNQANMPRYQLSDNPLHPPYYQSENYEPSIVSNNSYPLERNPLESSHSLVDLRGEPTSYPLSKAPSYRSEESYRRYDQTNEPVPPLPSQDSYTSSQPHDLYAQSQEGFAYEPSQYETTPPQPYQSTFPNAQPLGRPPPRGASMHHQPSLTQNTRSERPESQWDIGQYYSHSQQYEFDDYSHQPNAR